MLFLITEGKQRSDAVAAAAKKKAEDTEKARLLAIEQQRQHDEAAAKAADEERGHPREKIFSGEQALLTMAADWRAEAKNGKMEDSENNIALLLSHLTDLLATCITQQEDIHSLDDALTQVHSRLWHLEQRPVTAPDASSSNTSDRLEALEIDVGSLEDGVQLQQTATQQLEQRVCTTANHSSSEPRDDNSKVRWAGDLLRLDEDRPDSMVPQVRAHVAATLCQRTQAPQIIVTNKEAKNLPRSSAPGLGRDQHRPKVAVVTAATPNDQTSEAMSANEGDRLAAAREGGRTDKGRGRSKAKTNTASSPGPGAAAPAPWSQYGISEQAYKACICPSKHTRHARDSAIVFVVTAISTTQWPARQKARANRETKHRRERLDDILDAFGTGNLYVRIQVGQASFNALLDSGASRNFMSQAFMQKAGLGAQARRKANPTAIKLANGRRQHFIDRYIEVVPVYFAPHACQPVTFDILDTDFNIILGMPWLASADHTVNFHRRTLTIHNAFDAEVSCTIPLPYPPIRCQVMMAESFRATCAYEQPDEIGLCFLRTVAVADSSPTDLSSNPCVVWLLDELADIFESPTGVAPDRPTSHEIILEAGAVSLKGCIYRMSEEELTVLGAQLDDLLDKGWIRPSSSPYGAPVLFVRKKNKDLRLCFDYHKLNAQTVRNAGPLPRIDDPLERLGDAKYFSKLDLKSGYHQISIRPNDRYKSAFKTRYGHFEWMVMPFGLTNALVTFQAAMNNEFRAMLDRFGISPLSDKIQAIQEWSEPQNVTDVRLFLGLAGYYQRFIEGNSKIAAHLTKLQCEDRPFDFGEDARESFLALKAAALSAKVLHIYDPLLPMRVTTDASGYGIGAVLEQHDGVD
ncbi:hypothetical protein CBR_g38303 [Chara braunii]|uniref:Reverse transcriptase domain-containing protein n=1 Tax=Chara braunii TaxID=69332 RepID=A0A388LQ51_CHABU|nr:hypothetical protein CBR_g38303 [Chara braunii]|eukprot:GBG84332.1 hypothetical protein CBR_g38303 [Chara braunii]